MKNHPTFRAEDTVLAPEVQAVLLRYTERKERLEAASPALLEALKRILPTVIAHLHHFEFRTYDYGLAAEPSEFRDAVLALLHEDVEFALNAIAAASLE